MAPLMTILVKMVGVAVAAVAVYFWPQIMSWAREHLLPWVDKNIPALAEAVRLGFQDLDKIAVELRRAVRSAWRKLRSVLFNQTATFVELFKGEWAVQITSLLHDLEEREKPVVKIVTEQRLNYDDLPPDIRARAMKEGLVGTAVDILTTRDQLLADTV